MKKILGLGTLALAGVLAFTGCGKDKGMTNEEAIKYAEEQGYVKVTAPAALPAARKDNATCDVESTNTQYSKGCSGVNIENLKDYFDREDVEYIDLRDSGASLYGKDKQGNYITNTAFSNYSAGHLKGFKLVEYFAYVVGNEYQLFYQSGSIVDPDNAQKTIPVFAPRYIDSVEILKELFPQDKTLFIMCAGGSRVVPLMQLLDQYGWDMSKVYNVGGWGDYSDPENPNYDAYTSYRVTAAADTKYETLIGTAQGSSQGNSTMDLSVTVKVLYHEDLDVIGGAYLDTTASNVLTSTGHGYEEKVTHDKLYEMLNAFVGLSADEARAKVTEQGELAEGVDAIAGASNTTSLIFNAVINALPEASE